MIDSLSNLINRYSQFLSSLHAGKCQMWHFATYRKNKIAGMPFERVLQQPAYLPQALHFQKVIIENDSDKYIAYKNNVHHWTTRCVWNKFLPMLMHLLRVDFQQDKFVEIPYIWSTCDFSYHNLPNAKFKIKVFEIGKEEVGDHEVLRSVNNCPYMSISCYHSLFKLSHLSGAIENLRDAPIQRIAVNCDSMAIPVLPILACFCKHLLVVDNRTGKSKNYMKAIIDFKPQHYISLFTEENFLFNQKHIKQIL